MDEQGWFYFTTNSNQILGYFQYFLYSLSDDVLVYIYVYE